MGLKVNDLEHLVNPLISIDEYESKIDSDSIVVGFYVSDMEPAEDLSQFIESSGYDLMDTEVSPGADNAGNYVVFVEFLRDDKFPKKIQDILKAIAPLTGNKKWVFTYYGGHDQEVPFNEKNIIEYIRLKKEDQEEKQETLEFFKPSLLDNVLLDHKNITFIKFDKSCMFERVAIGSPELLIEAYDLKSKPLNFNSEVLRQCRVLNGMLGENWDVVKIGDYYIVANDSSNQIMFLK